MAEAPYRRCPKVTVPEGTTVYVLGDSISAGVGTGDRCWPVVLGELTSFRVVNLAQPGATVKSALVQTKGIKESRAVVIVEIGGNDLLGETAAAEFRDTLDTLVSSLRANQHQILLLELPLFPFKNAFGRAQRDVVSKYGVAMLPKRCLAAALGAQNGTLDGLHLSQAGHNALAGILAGVMERK
jgi:acyl-CoA thioesterase-1